MSDGMDLDGDAPQVPIEPPQPPVLLTGPAISATNSSGSFSMTSREPREPFREIPVKVHIRRPDKDNWTYMGRAVVAYEPNGPRTSARVVVRAAATQKVMCIFDNMYEVHAEKRGNFAVISCVEGSRVISWSLNAMNNSETLRLLTIIELACPFSGKSMAEVHRTYGGKSQRKIDRIIKDDRRRRHKRRKEADSLVDAFARSTLDGAQQQDNMTISGGSPISTA